MGSHRHDGNQISTELEALLASIGLPVSDTDDRDKAVGILVSSAGTRAASIEWFVSTTARSAAAREQIEGLADGRAGVLHRAARAYLHHALAGILQELGYSAAQTATGLRIEGLPGASAGAETAQALTESLRVTIDNLDEARERKKRDDNDEGDDGLAGVPARV